MKSRHIISLLLVSLLALSGCDQFNVTNNASKQDLNINITKIEFEPDHKRFHLNVEINDTLTAMLLCSSADSIHFETKEFLKNNTCDPKTQPQLESYENRKLKEINELKVDALFLIDLTLDSIAINQQNQIIKNLAKLFALDHLHVAFMKNGEVTPTMIATDYVMNNYFKCEPGEKYLYRALSSKIDEFKRILPNMSRGSKTLPRQAFFPSPEKSCSTSPTERSTTITNPLTPNTSNCNPKSSNK